MRSQNAEDSGNVQCCSIQRVRRWGREELPQPPKEYSLTSDCRASAADWLGPEPLSQEASEGRGDDTEGDSSRIIVTDPPSLDIMALPDNISWMDWWKLVCRENMWLEMRDAGDPAGSCPYCTLCSKWADERHLVSTECRKHARDFGPLLAHMLVHDNTVIAEKLHTKHEMPKQECTLQVPKAQFVRRPSRQPCSNPRCDFLEHTSRAHHGFCCGKCRMWHGDGCKNSGKVHGVSCEKHTREMVRQPCANPRCNFLAHTSDAHEGFCCGKCRQWHTQGYKKALKTHGKLCEEHPQANFEGQGNLKSESPSRIRNIAGNATPVLSRLVHSKVKSTSTSLQDPNESLAIPRHELQRFVDAVAAKEECDTSDEDALAPLNQKELIVVEDFAERVWVLQDSIKRKFRDGRTLETLISDLKQHKVDPMTCPSLILNVAVARTGRGQQREQRFYTLDHRRLWCMYQANCKRIRVRIKPSLSGKDFDNFIMKADGLGGRVYDLHVRS